MNEWLLFSMLLFYVVEINLILCKLTYAYVQSTMPPKKEIQFIS